MSNDYAIQCYYEQKIIKNRMLVLSKRAKSLERNITYILRELNKKEYSNLKIFLACTEDNMERFQKSLERHKLKGVELVTVDSEKYYRVLYSVEYLLTNTTFESTYIKKAGQKIINIWYRTTLKTVGRFERETQYFNYYNMQRNLAMADYLVVHNSHSIEQMLQSCDLNNLAKGKIICSGFPRNSIFFEDTREKQEKIRTSLNLMDKKIYLYAPSFEEIIRADDLEQVEDQLLFYMQQLDTRLDEDEVCLVKYPFMEENKKWKSLQHVVQCPKKYDLYDLMVVCDALIGDYSDCYLDFLVTGKKIVLFAYDYPLLRQRAYFDTSLEQLGLPMAISVDQLVKELRNSVNLDYQPLIEKYAEYDCINAAEKMCQAIFCNKDSCKMEQISGNGKPNVILYTADWNQEDTKCAIARFFATHDLKETNYYICTRNKDVKNVNDLTELIPPQAGIIVIQWKPYLTEKEESCLKDWTDKKADITVSNEVVDKSFQREAERYLGMFDFSAKAFLPCQSVEVQYLYEKGKGEQL